VSVAAPLVSVVVPAYNHERYVEAALRSVASQTHPEIELIVVDDASTDATPVAVERWRSGQDAGRLRRIEVLRNEANLGAHASLNRGMAAARGEFISLLNSDDYYAPARIATLLARMEREGSRFGFSAVMPVDEHGREDLSSPLARRIAAAREEIAALPSVSFGFIFRQLAVSTGNFLLHRSLYDEVGGFAPLRYCHDWDFALRAFLRTEPVFVDEYLYYYRFHESNSYAALDDVARQETEAVLSGHYARCLGAVARNERAPTPGNWPGVFEHYIDFFELEGLWHRVCREHGVPVRYPVGTSPRPRLSRYAAVDDNEPGASIGASLRQVLQSLRRARAQGWRNVPRVVNRAVRLWLRAGSR
jgi:glycosyltransferase involved in cell wall biosynthesis